MTTPPGRVRPSPTPVREATARSATDGSPPARAEVVVGILEDLGAVALVHRALDEAGSRQASVRVVRVLPPGSAQDDVLAADSLAYAVTRAADADADGVTVPSSFEVAVGDPVLVLLDRASTAALLVVGGDREGSTVAQRCQADATCTVLVVPSP